MNEIEKLKKEIEGLKGLITISSKQQLKLLAKIESLEEENKELKEKLDSYEEYGGALDEGQAWADEAMASRNKLEMLKPILEHYANTKLGELQPDGTYSFVYATNDFGIQRINFDPRPAKEGLKIIEDEDNKNV